MMKTYLLTRYGNVSRIQRQNLINRHYRGKQLSQIVCMNLRNRRRMLFRVWYSRHRVVQVEMSRFPVLKRYVPFLWFEDCVLMVGVGGSCWWGYIGTDAEIEENFCTVSTKSSYWQDSDKGVICGVSEWTIWVMGSEEVGTERALY